MRPPVCDICGADFDPFGESCGLVSFAKRPTDRAWDEKRKETGFIGHPPYSDWYCRKHYSEAFKLQHETIDTARRKLREIFLDNNLRKEESTNP